MAQESYLTSSELGVSFVFKITCLTQCNFNCLHKQHTIDEVENLIKKHEAFEKSAAAQEERFAALERLTTVSDILVALF